MIVLLGMGSQASCAQQVPNETQGLTSSLSQSPPVSFLYFGERNPESNQKLLNFILFIPSLTMNSNPVHPTNVIPNSHCISYLYATTTIPEQVDNLPGHFNSFSIHVSALGQPPSNKAVLKLWSS